MTSVNKSSLIVASPRDLAPAERLAALLGVDAQPVELGRFPDGETKLRVPASAETVILYWGLDRPDQKIMPLALAVSALRDAGAARIVLAAPYLCYMRQDKAFREREPVSQRVIARILSQWVDDIITVEPHIHRAASLQSVFPDIRAVNVSAAPLLADLIRRDAPDGDVLLMGPDAEAAAWTKAVADLCGFPYAVMTKKRLGDRQVKISCDDKISIEGRDIYLVDDLVSSGGTLIEAARILKTRGAQRIEALVVHALCDDAALGAIIASDVERIRSLDTGPHSTNAAEIASLLADALRGEVLS